MRVRSTDEAASKGNTLACFQKVSSSSVSWVIHYPDWISVVFLSPSRQELLKLGHSCFFTSFPVLSASRRCSSVVDLLGASLNKQHVNSKIVAYWGVFESGSQNVHRRSSSVISCVIYNRCRVGPLLLMMAELSFLKEACCYLLFLFYTAPRGRCLS
jgi:hypothetical protein